MNLRKILPEMDLYMQELRYEKRLEEEQNRLRQYERCDTANRRGRASLSDDYKEAE